MKNKIYSMGVWFLILGFLTIVGVGIYHLYMLNSYVGAGVGLIAVGVVLVMGAAPKGLKK